jgi:benzoyl-CoA reductase/2-hydroxyglutaryl-CoA dehydratase subunit BcrC/BadD/HgdB
MSLDTQEKTPPPAGAAAGFERLRRSYRDPLAGAKAAAARGQRVVGLMGAVSPFELVLAAGAYPVRIGPTQGRPTPTADYYMDDVISPDTKSLFESAVTGEFEFLDLLVCSRAEDKLYYYLKEMVRIGRGAKAPRLHMFDLLPSRREAVREYNQDNVAWLVDAIERAVGRKIADADITEAARLTNRSRALQRRLMSLRWDGKVAGSEAIEAIGASYFMDAAPYAEALEAWLGTLEASPATQKGPRLLVATSEPFSHTHLHRRLEAAGAVVVSEDDQWGARAPGDDIVTTGNDAQGAILNKYWLDTAHGSVQPREAREAWFLEQIRRPDVDGIVFYLPPSDHQFGWDYPRLAAEVAALDKPSKLLRRNAAIDDAIDADIAEFVGSLKGGLR